MRQGAVLSIAVVLASVLALVGTHPAAAACVSSTGPGIPAPTALPAGIPGFHAAWYGQSGYMSLCPGDSATATVAYYNSGSLGWVSGAPGQTAFLGTWNPEPGQDRPSALGGDGTAGSPATGWPRYNRLAAQPSTYVAPGQVAWFQFQVRAPLVPGTYRIALRPLVEGATWMEDYGVFWVVNVIAAQGGGPAPTPSASPPTATATPTPAPTPVATLPPSPGLTIWSIDGIATLLADDGTYLGIVSSNRYALDSICNQYGTYGSPYALDSVRNKYGSYGSPYALDSSYNPYTSTPPLIMYRGSAVGYLTKNKYLPSAIDPDQLFSAYGCVY